MEGLSLKLDASLWQGSLSQPGSLAKQARARVEHLAGKVSIQLLLCFADAVSMSSLFIVVMYINGRMRCILYFS